MDKTAIIDIDNTLWQFCDAFYIELEKTNRNIPAPDRWSSPDFWQGYCSEAEIINAINFIHLNQDSGQYKPYVESRDFLSALRKCDFHIILASHRLIETRRPTENWLKIHRLPYDELHLSSDKTILNN